jgi:hypothetical protein
MIMSVQLKEDTHQISVSDIDRLGLAKLIQRVVSDSDFRALFQSDPQDAIEHSGVSLSPVAAAALVKNAKLGAALTLDMDNVASAVFFFFAA